MKTINEFFETIANIYVVIFVVVFITLLVNSCTCTPTPSTQTAVIVEEKKEPVLTDPIIDSRSAYDKSPYHGVIVKQSGMRYAVVHIYNEGGWFVLNLTKDSLEVQLLKKQLTWSKDSLQIEVSKKYLRN